MQKLTKFALIALVVMVLIATVAILVPRGLHTVAAQAAQLVQDADSPGRHPWAATCTLSGPLTGEVACTPTLTVPRNEELIIQAVDFASTVSPAKASGYMIISMTTTAGGNPARWDRYYKIVGEHDLSAFQTLGPVSISGTTPVSLSIAMYADAGTSIEIHARIQVLSPDLLRSGETVNGKVMLIGHYVTL